MSLEINVNWRGTQFTVLEVLVYLGYDKKSPRQLAWASPLSPCTLSNYQFSRSRLSV